eukprot:Rhum_TRINITY_DN15489_c3_g4::Rhum_TRINITY_DN15489_c3_g4_i1::g.159375::m.159375
MHLRISLHRTKLNKQRSADATDGVGREYPWDWEPVTEPCPNNLAAMWPSVEAGWSRSRSHTLFVALHNWPNQLRWDVAEDGPHVAVLELVLDFEIVTGIDVPVQVVKDEEPRSTFSRKAKAFGNLLRTAEHMHGSRVIPATFNECSGWLRSLTVHAGGMTGFDRRPVLGVETLDVIDELRESAEQLGDEELCADIEEGANDQ